MAEFTLEFDDDLFIKAKAVATARGTTVENMVLEFFRDLHDLDEPSG